MSQADATRACRYRIARRRREPPRMALVDLRANAGHAGVSTPAIQAIERHLRDDGQVLVFLNRRGYAPTLLCTACGWIAPCSECDARLTVHLSAGRLRCHHCGSDTAAALALPAVRFCREAGGQGTERIEEALTELFPGVTLARLDRDVVRRRGDMEEVVRRMASGEARILVGTQMVTKGHDFPNVTLVVVLNADQGLFSTDFRAPERLAQTIVQVAGRAGRGSTARRGAHPNRVSRPSAAAEPAVGRLRRLRARGAGRSGRKRRGRRSAGSRRCAIRRKPRRARWNF